MINTLVSLDADLASSIALRYSCRMTQLIDMHLQTIHVEEVEKEGYPPGSGWVRTTWEKGLLQTAQDEIAQLINADKSSCPSLDRAIVRIGDREEELLKEIEENSYDLLLEGVLNSFDAQLFYQKVRSKLYRYARCPIVLVKNLVSPDRAALLLSDSKDIEAMVRNVAKLFKQSSISIDLVAFSTKRSGQASIMKTVAEATAQELDAVAADIEMAATLLAEQGLTLSEKWFIRDSPKKIGEMLGKYGLVAACISGNTAKKIQIMELLSRVPTATLLCKQ